MRFVIIGAGATGRGLLARLTTAPGNSLTFIDADERLVEALQRAGSYEVKLYGGQPVVVSGFSAVHTGKAEARRAVAEAECILTAVGVDRLPAVLALLSESAALRSRPEARQPVLLCENGSVEAAKQFGSVRAAYPVCPCAILCTCTHGGGLTVFSENISRIYCDAAALEGFRLPSAEFVPSEKFDSFEKRKLYTYNCINACICYLGALKGYALLGDAARDPQIEAAVARLAALLDRMLPLFYSVKAEEQRAFTLAAIEKFRNREIVDSIARNARDVLRKLGPKERISAPIQMADALGLDSDILHIVAAAALCYGVEKEALPQAQAASADFLCRVMGLPEKREADKIAACYQALRSHGDLSVFLP